MWLSKNLCEYNDSVWSTHDSLCWLIGMATCMLHCEIATLLYILTLTIWRLIFVSPDVCMSCRGRPKHSIVFCSSRLSFPTMHRARRVNPSRKISVRQYFPRTVASDSLVSVRCQLFTRPFAHYLVMFCVMNENQRHHLKALQKLSGLLHTSKWSLL